MADSPQAPKSVWMNLGRRSIDLVAAMAIFILLLTAIAYLGRLSWRLELLCHWRMQYFWLLLLAAAVLLVARRWRMGTATALGALVNLTMIALIYWPTSQPQTTGQSLHIMSFNVLSSNPRYADVLNYLRRENADIVLLPEANHAWAEQLATLGDLYPYQHLSPRNDDFGIALLSKRPWREVRTVELGDWGVPSIVAEFDSGERLLTFIGTHPPPPLSAAGLRERNQAFGAIAKLARQSPGGVLVAGDLNTTEHSPYYGDLLRDSGLRDSRRGFGIQPSWSPGLPLLGLAIDHCLVSPDITVTERWIGPDLGSDHRPVNIVLW